MSYLVRNVREHLGSISREIRVALTRVPNPKKWVFVVGCYNSGTTLLAEILGKHPKISALPTEGQFITDQFVKDYEIGLPRMWTKREDLFRLTENDAGPDVRRLKKEWGMRLDLSRPILLEKSPPNIARTRWLQKHFHNAHFIGIVRNGYAVAEGIRRKADPVHKKGGWSIEDSIHQWVRCNEVLLEDSKFLKNFLLATYEEFTENTEATLKRITDFLNIGSFAELDTAQNWNIHERNEAIRNMNAESTKRLSPIEIELIEKNAANMLRHFNYRPL